MFDLTLSTLLTRLVVLLPIIGIYGLATAGAARLLGDHGPAHDGRQTINPLAHLDMLGGLAFVGFGLGWMTPLAITPQKLRGGFAGVLGVMLAGTLSLFVLAAIAVLVLPHVANLTSLSASSAIGAFLIGVCRLGIAFALFNLVPLPMLGGQYLLWLAAPRLAEWTDKYRLLIAIAMLVLVATGLPGRIIDPGAQALIRLIFQDVPVLDRGI